MQITILVNWPELLIVRESQGTVGVQYNKSGSFTH